MSAGLSTPLHLAANLLAVFAAAGAAIAVLNRPGDEAPPARRSASEWVLAVGWSVAALGHALDGALVEAASVVVPWFIAGGLVLVALGIGRRRVRVLGDPGASTSARTDLARAALTRSALSRYALAPAVIVTEVPIAAAVVGAVGGVVAGVRAALAGRRAVVLGLGLLAWAAARALAPSVAATSAWLTIGGALLVAAWLWQVSATRLLAKLVTAFIACLLGVVVLLAVVLSTIGSASLVEEDLRTLSQTGTEVAQTLSETWPREAIQSVGPFARLSDTVAELVARGSGTGLDNVRQTLVASQDVLAILDPQGRVQLVSGPLPGVDDGAFLLALAGSEAVDRMVDGQREAGGLLTVGGTVVAIGGVAVFDQPTADLRPEDVPTHLLVAARVADDVWAAQAASQLPLELIVTVGDELSAASDDVDGVLPQQVVAAMPRAAETAALSVAGRELFAAAAPLIQPSSVEEVGRVIAVRSGEVLAQVERDQARQLFIVALLGGLLAGAVVGAVSGRLVAPIRRLTAAAASVREGDLGAQADVGSRDEVGELGRTFNEMTASLSAQSQQLRQAAEVQSRLRARLEALNASMSDALIAVDADGRIITFNPAAERLVGRPWEAAIGQPLGAVLEGTAPGERTAADALGPATSERVAAVQLRLRSRVGHVVPTAATAAPVRGADGTVLGRVLVLRDVTREVEVERMKSEFLSNVSHELRSPLTPIKGYADVLARRAPGPEDTRRYAQLILESTARLERIVAMIVDFAALDSGRMEPQLVDAEVDRLVHRVLERWRAREPKRTFSCGVDEGLPRVRIDVRMIERCLDELVDNAIKFSPGGEPIVVTARSRPGSGDGGVVVSVRDHGVGIGLDKTATLFSDFYQADGSETRHFGGLGLGLALVRRIVDALDGDASIESEPGGGAAVHVVLPAAER